MAGEEESWSCASSPPIVDSPSAHSRARKLNQAHSLNYFLILILRNNHQVKFASYQLKEKNCTIKLDIKKNTNQNDKDMQKNAQEELNNHPSTTLADHHTDKHSSND